MTRKKRAPSSRRTLRGLFALLLVSSGAVVGAVAVPSIASANSQPSYMGEGTVVNLTSVYGGAGINETVPYPTTAQLGGASLANTDFLLLVIMRGQASTTPPPPGWAPATTGCEKENNGVNEFMAFCAYYRFHTTGSTHVQVTTGVTNTEGWSAAVVAFSNVTSLYPLDTPAIFAKSGSSIYSTHFTPAGFTTHSPDDLAVSLVMSSMTPSMVTSIQSLHLTPGTARTFRLATYTQALNATSTPGNAYDLVAGLALHTVAAAGTSVTFPTWYASTGPHWAGLSLALKGVTTALVTKPMVTITPDPVTLTYTQEQATTFTVAVVAIPGHGYPIGTVILETGSNTLAVVEAPSSTHGTTTRTIVNVHLASTIELAAGSHQLTADFIPATTSSSKTTYSFTASTSTATFDVLTAKAFTAKVGTSTTTATADYHSSITLSVTTLTQSDGGEVTFWHGTTYSPTLTHLCSFTLSSATSCSYQVALTASATPDEIHAHWAGSTSYSAGTSTNDVALSVDKATVATTITITNAAKGSTSSLKFGTETAALFDLTVTGQAGEGEPTPINVSVWTGSGYVAAACTRSTPSGTDAFTCTAHLAATQLGVAGSPHQLHAYYSGGTSTNYVYGTSTSATSSSDQYLTVTITPKTAPTTTKVTFSTGATSGKAVNYGSETSQHLKVTVTGQTSDGNPTTGTVAIRTSSGSTVGTCSGRTASGSDAATYTCMLTPAALTASPSTPYALHAYFSDGTSTTTNYTYNASTSASPASSTPTVSLSVDKTTPALSVYRAPSTGAVGEQLPATAFEVTLSGVHATGTITFRAFGPSSSAPSSCGTGWATWAGNTAAVSNGASTSGTYHAATGFTPTAAGKYWWYATYGGDTNYNGQSFACPTLTASTTARSPIKVTVTGTKTYGSTSTSFATTYKDPPPSNVSTTGTASCSGITTGKTVSTATLSAGAYTLDSATCSGVSLSGSGAGSYFITYVGGSFLVSQAPLTVTITGSMTYGTTGTGRFSVTTTPPGTVTFTKAALACTEVSTGGGAAISSALSAGHYTLAGAACSGLTLETTKAGDYTVTIPYTGSAFTVNKAIPPAFTVKVVGFATTTARLSYGSSAAFAVSGLTGLTGGTVSVYTYATTSSVKVTLCTFTLSATVHSCSYLMTFTPGTTHHVWASWSGTTDYTTTTSTNTVTLSDYSTGGGGGPSAPTAPTPPAGASSYKSCSVNSGMLSCANDTVTVTAATGPGALTVSQYASNPEGPPSFSSTGEYFDVGVTPGSSFSSLTIKDCNLGGGTKLYWWNTNTASWEGVSPVSGPTGTPPCLSATSTPAISELTGTIFAVGTPSSSGPVVTRVAGSTADATAVAELERTFDAAKKACPSSRSVVLATTKEYEDALSSQFLSQSLTTGTLLTRTTSLSAVTAAALKAEGITTVYVVGGPLAITTTVVKAIEDLTAYGCGGTAPSGKVTVKRIAGPTAAGTAMVVAEHVGTAASMTFAVAYGAGKYNDTAGKGSTAPAGPVPTAILASANEFQDAEAASVMSYHTKLPLLLTGATSLSTTALAAIQKLGIEQVVLMGGPLAVSNTVEGALVGHGVSVLRIAGHDATDTARELARFEIAAPPAGLGWTPGHRIMATRGDGFTDGIAGAVLDSPHNTATGAGTRPLLLTESPTTIGTYLTTFLEVTGHSGIDATSAKTVSALTVLGGNLAVSTAVVAQMQTDLGH